ncbi:MAG: IS3 family transposase [Prevotella sp.]|nr:IS3 family transposase [Prevotella sp.]
MAKKSAGFSGRAHRPRRREWAQAIQSLRPEYMLGLMLDIKGMARSTYYYGVKERKDKYEEIRKAICRIYQANRGRYGYRRICMALDEEGIHINHKTVHSLMKEMGLKGVRKKRAYHSYKGEVGRVAPNVLQRDFTASAPMMKWATDVSQITIGNCKCYLSPILDLFNGEVVSYTISDSPNLKMVIDMLRKAFRRKKNLNGLLLHSDQGWHYQHIHYQHMLKQRGIVQSMSRKGNCLDNSVIENFFGLMKNELLYVNHFDSMDDFKRQLADYIDYYNNKRIKLKLKMSPVQYRTHFYRQIN